MWQTFWRYVILIDVMTNVLTSWNFLTTWYTFWRLDALCDVMSNFITSWCVVTFCWHDVFLTPWPAFCLLDIFVFIISGAKYNENYNDIITHFWISWYVFHVMTNFLTSWRVFIFMTNCLALWRIFDFMTHFLTSWHIFYFMTNLWRHDKPFDVMVCFWCHDELGDVMTNIVKSWQTWWRYYVFLLHFMINFVIKSNDETFDIMTNFLTSWRLFWHHDVFMTLWRICDVTNYWRHDVCCTYWRQERFDNMTHFVDILTHFLTSWLI